MVVGGGLAGLTLGVALRQRDVPVTLCEAGSYPRQRVRFFWNWETAANGSGEPGLL